MTAVCDTARIELVHSLGADRVVDYTKEDFTKIDDTFDFVFDSVGKSSFFACERLLKPGGVFIGTDLGPYASNVTLAWWTSAFGSYKGKRMLFPMPKHTKKDIELFTKLMEEGKFKPVVDRTYALEEIVEGFQYVESQQKTGNVVVTIKNS